MYALLLREPALGAWVDRKDYLTDWLLFDRIALVLSGVGEDARPDHPEYRRVLSLCEDYLADPLGEQRDYPSRLLPVPRTPSPQPAAAGVAG